MDANVCGMNSGKKRKEKEMQRIEWNKRKQVRKGASPEMYREWP